MAERVAIIDASDLVLGRMASLVAKRSLNGEKVIIVNAEKAVISGKRLSIIKESHDFLQIGHPRKGPFHPRIPDDIVKRTIRGMLPWKKPKGRQAYKRIQVFIGIPEEFKEKEKETFPEADASNLRCPYIRVSQLAESIGWKPKGR